MKKWQKIRTKKVYNFGKFYQVEVDQVLTPGGKDGEYSVVRMKPFSIIVPIDEEGMIYFVKQHRYTTNQFVIELPMGNTDGEEPFFAAKRELEEETGLVSDDWTSVGRVQVANGFAELYAYIFIARNVKLTKNPKRDPLDKDLFEILKFSLPEVKDMIADGTIDEGDTIFAIFKAFFV